MKDKWYIKLLIFYFLYYVHKTNVVNQKIISIDDDDEHWNQNLIIIS